MSKVVGLALEGGGARGAYEAGAVKLLKERGYEFSFCCGTSIGAVNAAMVAQGDSDKLLEIWKDMSYNKIFDIEEDKLISALNKEINANIIKYLSGFVTNTIKEKGIDTSKMRSIVESYIDEEKLRKSSCGYGLVTISVSDKKGKELYLEDIPDGKIWDYVLASGRLPGFRQEQLDGKYYMDGGMYNNCPINMIDKKGIKDIIAIKVGSILPTKDEKKLLSRKDLNIIVIKPNIELPSILAFDNSNINFLINLGYYDAIKELDCLDGENYYLNKIDENICFRAFVDMKDEDVNKVYKLLKLKNVENSKKVFLEIIMPMVLKKIGKDNLSTYKSAMIAILEYAADILEVERFNIYSLKEFVYAINKKIGNIDEEKKYNKATRVIFKIIQNIKIK